MNARWGPVGSRRVGAGCLLAATLACAPRLPVLVGVPAPAVLPAARLPTGHHRIVFTWQMEDRDFTARGEGAARLASPDSARLDFFVSGGIAAGAAVLVGDTLRVPSRADDVARRFIPPAPLLWASLGRLAIPVIRDTTVRVDGDTLRADIGTPVAWRLLFVRDTLRRLERVGDGRIVEWVERFADGRVRYRNEISRRQLDLLITRFDDVGGFDPDIWILP